MSKVTNNAAPRTQPSQASAQGQNSSAAKSPAAAPPAPASKPEAEQNLKQAQKTEHQAFQDLQNAEGSGDQTRIDGQRQIYTDAVRNREVAQQALDTIKGNAAQQTQSELQADRFVPQGQNPSDWQKAVGTLAMRDDHSAIFNGTEVSSPTTPEQKAQAVADINQQVEKYQGKSFDELVTTVPPQEKAEFLALYGVGFNGAAKNSLQAENRGHQLNKTFAEVVAGMQTPGHSSVETKMMGGRGHKIHMEVAADDKGDTQLESFNVKRNKKKGFFSKAASSIKKGFKKYGGAVLTVASFIPGPVGIAARIGQAVAGAYNAVKNKDWVGGIASVAGGAASGIAAAAGKAISGTTATVAAGARAIERGARAVQAGTAAYRSQDPAALLGAVAAGAGGVAGAIGGVAAGSAKTLEQVASWADRGARTVNTVEALRQGDLLAAAANGASVGADLAGRDSKLGARLDDVAAVAGTTRRVQQGIDSGDYAGAAAAVSGLAARASTDPAQQAKLATTARVLGDASTIQRSLDGGDLSTAMSAAGDMADALGVGDDGVIAEIREDIDQIKDAHAEDDMEGVREGFRQIGGHLKEAISETGERLFGREDDRLQDRHVQQGARSVKIARGLANQSAALGMGASLPAAAGADAQSAASAATAAAVQQRQLEDSQGFEQLKTGQQNSVRRLFNSVDAQGQTSLVGLTERQIEGKNALLDRDGDGRTLGASLQHLAKDQPASMVSSIMQEIADPTQINQGDHQTCSTASMQYLLCKNNPAEYARIMNGLLSKEGRVTLANGDELKRVADSVAPDTSTDRSASERIFQAAMMDYCNGGNSYSNRTDRHSRARIPQGLSAGEVKKGLEALTGKPVNVEYSNWAPNFFKGGKLGERVARDFAGERMVKLQIPVAAHKNAKGEQVAADTYGHAVTVTAVKDGRVYFKNTQLPGLGARLALDLKSHRVENQNRDHGIESMSIEDFARITEVAYAVQ